MSLIKRGRVKKLEQLARGLCIFFRSPSQSPLSLQNVGIEIYDEPYLAFNLHPATGPRLPPRRRAGQCFPGKRDKSRASNTHVLAKKGSSRQRVSLSVRNESGSDLSANKKREQRKVSADDSAVSKKRAKVSEQRKPHQLRKSAKSVPKFESCVKARGSVVAQGKKQRAEGLERAIQELCTAGKKLVRRSLLPHCSTSAKLHSRLNTSADSCYSSLFQQRIG